MKAYTHRSYSPTVILSAFIAGVSVLTAGCATFPENSVGQHPDRKTSEGLQLTLKPSSGDHVVAGSPLVFEVTLTNTGSEPITIPDKPVLSLKWRYPNGWVDSTVPPDSTDGDIDFVTLAPGESLRTQEAIRTSHIPNRRRQLGIIEFRAAYVSDQNPQPSDQQVWEGISMSNTYGVVVAER